MTGTDVVERLAVALVQIANADDALAAITGRSTRNLVPWNSLGAAGVPVVAYYIVSAVPIGGAGDNREMVVQFSCFAEGATADADVNALAEAIEMAFTQPKLESAGIDAMVLPAGRARRGVQDDPEGARNRRRADIDLTFWVTK